MKLRENPKFKKKEPDKTSRRSFLKKSIHTLGSILLTGYIGLIPIACKKTPTTPDRVIPVTYTGYVRGLINDSAISSGKIIFNHSTEIPISSGSYTINTGHNLTEGNYDVRVETTVNNHVSQYTANFVNGVLYKESQSNERPDPNKKPKGWIIYLIREDSPFGITQSIAEDKGDIYYGAMHIRPISAKVWGVSIDTAQTLGIGQDRNSGQILTGTEPSTLAKKIGKIIYNRAPHHNIIDGIDKEE